MKPSRSSLVVFPALLASLIAAACSGGGGGGQLVAQATPQAVSVKTAPVSRGNIQQVLSYTGDVSSSSAIQVMAQVAGRVERINVDVGSHVNAGDVLVQLDTQSLQATLDQNQAALAAAEAKLASMQSGAKQEDIDAAQAAVANAAGNLALQEARLEQVSGPARSEQIRAAQAQLGQLQTKLAQTQAGAKPEDVAALQAAVDQAAGQVEQDQGGVQLAQTGRDGATATAAAQQDAVKALEQAVASNQAQLDDATYRQQQAAEGKGGPGIRQQDIDAAQQQVNEAYLAWQKLLNTPTQEDLAIAEAAVNTAQKQVKVAQDEYDAAKNCSATSGCPDTDVAKAQVAVAKAQETEAEASLAKVQVGPTPYDIQAAEAAFHAAEANRDKLMTGGSSDAEALQLNVEVRQTALSQAQAQLGQAQAALQQTLAQQQGSEATLEVAQAKMTADQAAQTGAQARLDSARNPSVFDVSAAQQAVAQAQAQLDQLVNPDPNAVQQQQAVVAQGQAQLNQAQANLAGVMHPFKDEDIQAQQALVDQARAQVQAAQVSLDEATVRAPVAGVVSEKLVSEGALIGETTPLVTLVPPGLELDVSVEEANLPAVKPGQPVSVNVAAYPNQQFKGTITTVSPTVDPKSRTVPVKISLQDPQGLLRPGMFAQLGIVTQSKPNALLIPRSAVVTRNDQPTAFVVRDGKAVQVPLKLGISDSNNYEVTSGLQEGEQVVVSGQTDLSNGDTVIASAS